MKLSVVIPVYNEENINETISHMRSLSDCEIIVSDANGETVKNIQDKSVIKIISSKGRGVQMNTGADNAKGDVLLFLHADTRLSAGFEDEIRKAFEAGYDVGAFRLKIDSERLFFRVIEWGVALRNSFSKVPYGDQAIFCTREAFQRVGGYQEISLMEDVRFMEACKKAKLNIYLSQLPVITSARRWEEEGLIYGTLRNRALMLSYWLGADPEKLKKYYK